VKVQKGNNDISKRNNRSLNTHADERPLPPRFPHAIIETGPASGLYAADMCVCMIQRILSPPPFPVLQSSRYAAGPSAPEGPLLPLYIPPYLP
jgi:hypothetical protein